MDMCPAVLEPEEMLPGKFCAPAGFQASRAPTETVESGGGEVIV